jgi:hypothetical protein
VKKKRRTSRRYLPKPLASLDAARHLNRARLYRAQARKLPDTVASEPNWPKHFLITHAIELAITAYLVFRRGITGPRSPGKRRPPKDHDLMELYEAAVRGGLKSNPLVLKELPSLSELHKLHYARYPQVESKPVPARISKYNKMLDHFFGDIENALGDASRIRA